MAYFEDYILILCWIRRLCTILLFSHQMCDTMSCKPALPPPCPSVGAWAQWTLNTNIEECYITLQESSPSACPTYLISVSISSFGSHSQNCLMTFTLTIDMNGASWDFIGSVTMLNSNLHTVSTQAMCDLWDWDCRSKDQSTWVSRDWGKWSFVWVPSWFGWIMQQLKLESFVFFFTEVKCICKDATQNLQTNPLLKCGKAFKLCRLNNHARKLNWLSASTEDAEAVGNN